MSLILISFLLIALALYAWARPLPATVATYLWWQAFSDTITTDGVVSSGDAHIYYRSLGSGKPLVLLHGGLSSDLDWMGMLPSLSKNFQVIVINLRGHGRSTIGATPFTYRLMATDIHAVLGALNIERSDFAGWSDGGNVAMLFALEYPARIDRLITISANFHPSGINEVILEKANSTPEEMGSWLSRAMYHMQSSEPDQWPRLRQYVSDMWQSYPQLTINDLQKIQVPTLVIVGAEDHVDQEHAVEMAESIPNATLLVLPNVGHAVPREAPRRLLEAISAFLAADDAP